MFLKTFFNVLLLSYFSLFCWMTVRLLSRILYLRLIFLIFSFIHLFEFPFFCLFQFSMFVWVFFSVYICLYFSFFFFYFKYSFLSTFPITVFSHFFPLYQNFSMRFDLYFIPPSFLSTIFLIHNPPLPFFLLYIIPIIPLTYHLYPSPSSPFILIIHHYPCPPLPL